METRSSQPTRPSRWERRPHLARLVRVLVWVTPAVASSATVLVLSRVVHRPGPIGAALAWWAGLLLVSTGMLLGTERIARRLLPLAALLRLSLAFPDAAPSRFGVLLRAGNSRRIARPDDRPGADRSGGAGDGGARGGGARDGGTWVPELLARRRPAVAAPPDTTPAEATAELARLVALLHSHDRRTRGHSERVRAYAVLIGQELRLSSEELDRLQWSALLHDIGKVTVPPELLNKPSALTEEEFLIVKGHPAAGAQLIEPLRWWLGEWADSVGQHHERYDGNGYPLRLGGTGISYGGRIVAVADAYDVMTAARSYKKPLESTVARTELTRCAGTHFDPVVVRAFLSVSIGRVQRASGPLGWLTNLPILGSAPLGNAAVAAIQTIVPTITPTALSAATAALITAGTLAASAPMPAADPGLPHGPATDAALGALMPTTAPVAQPTPTSGEAAPIGLEPVSTAQSATTAGPLGSLSGESGADPSPTTSDPAPAATASPITPPPTPPPTTPPTTPTPTAPPTSSTLPYVPSGGAIDPIDIALDPVTVASTGSKSLNLLAQVGAASMLYGWCDTGRFGFVGTGDPVTIEPLGATAAYICEFQAERADGTVVRGTFTVNPT